MRAFFIIVFSLFLTQSVGAQGVRFVHGTLEEILSLAQKEDKLVFIDAYTDWCAPCRVMTNTVFPKGEVGSFFNEHFISIKINMEKGEGPEIGLKYNVRSYPSLLFIDSEGTLVHKVAGYLSAKKLIEQGKVALNPTLSLKAMEERYLVGDRNPEFLLKYLDLRYKMGDNSHEPVAEEYLKTQKDWSKPGVLNAIFKYVVNADSKMFQYMTEHKDLFYRKFGASKVGQKIQSILNKKIEDKTISLAQLQDIYRKAYAGPNSEIEASKVRMTYYRRRGNRKAFAQAALDHYKKYPCQNAAELNDVGATFYDVISKRKYLRKAIKLVKKSIKLDSSPENNLTLAQLYFKLNKKRKARKAALTSIALAKAMDEDYDDADELLKEIER